MVTSWTYPSARTICYNNQISTYPKSYIDRMYREIRLVRSITNLLNLKYKRVVQLTAIIFFKKASL